MSTYHVQGMYVWYQVWGMLMGEDSGPTFFLVFWSLAVLGRRIIVVLCTQPQSWRWLSPASPPFPASSQDFWLRKTQGPVS